MRWFDYIAIILYADFFTSAVVNSPDFWSFLLLTSAGILSWLAYETIREVAVHGNDSYGPRDDE
jgi:hypothetical protein